MSADAGDEKQVAALFSYPFGGFFINSAKNLCYDRIKSQT